MSGFQGVLLFKPVVYVIPNLNQSSRKHFDSFKYSAVVLVIFMIETKIIIFGHVGKWFVISGFEEEDMKYCHIVNIGVKDASLIGNIGPSKWVIIVDGAVIAIKNQDCLNFTQWEHDEWWVPPSQ